MIWLDDGTGQKKLPGFDHRIHLGAGIKSKDQGGETSSTASSFQGFKPSRIRIRCKIRFKDTVEIELLRKMFYATTDFEPVTYRIVEEKINAWGIDQVRFSGELNMDPDESLQLYMVAFELRQVVSASEMLEQRTPPPLIAEPTEDPVLENLALGAGSEDLGTLDQVMENLNQTAKDYHFES